MERLRVEEREAAKLAATDAKRLADTLAADAAKNAAEAEAGRLEAQRLKDEAERVKAERVRMEHRLRVKKEAEAAAAQKVEEQHRLQAKKEDEAAAAQEVEVRRREAAAKAEAVAASEKAQAMLETARNLKAESEEQQTQAERLQAKCEERALRLCTRVHMLANNPSAASAEVDIETSDDEAVESMVACSVQVQSLEATRKTKNSEVCVCPFPGMLV